MILGNRVLKRLRLAVVPQVLTAGLLLVMAGVGGGSVLVWVAFAMVVSSWSLWTGRGPVALSLALSGLLAEGAMVAALGMISVALPASGWSFAAMALVLFGGSRRLVWQPYEPNVLAVYSQHMKSVRSISFLFIERVSIIFLGIDLEPFLEQVVSR